MLMLLEIFYSLQDRVETFITFTHAIAITKNTERKKNLKFQSQTNKQSKLKPESFRSNELKGSFHLNSLDSSSEMLSTFQRNGDHRTH